MNANPVHLLKLLEPAVRPVGAPPTTTPKPGADSPRFDQLLKLAQAGGVSSGRRIENASTSDRPLDAAHLQKIAAGADQAEALGATKAVVVVDGRVFQMDVASRTLTNEVQHESNPQVVLTDAAVVLPQSESDSP